MALLLCRPKHYHFNQSLFEDDCLLHSFVLTLVTSKQSGRNRMHTPRIVVVYVVRIDPARGILIEYTNTHIFRVVYA